MPSRKKIIKFMVDSLLVTVIMFAMAWAFLEGQEKELHRMQVACESQRALGYPVDCGYKGVVASVR